MLERRSIATREGPIGPDAIVERLPVEASLRPLAPTARFSLRLRVPSNYATAVGDFRLDQPMNRSVQAGTRWSARLGPGEWLIGGAEAEAEAIQTQVEGALDNVPHALVDISHRNVAFEIAGSAAAAALNAGCPLDLHGTAFPPGAATRTLLGKAEIVLMRPGEAPLYQVECWRSFAPYVYGFLVEAVHGLGAL